MGALKDWVKQDWVRIGTDGKIKGKCGTSKDKERRRLRKRNEREQKERPWSKTPSPLQSK